MFRYYTGCYWRILYDALFLGTMSTVSSVVIYIYILFLRHNFTTGVNMEYMHKYYQLLVSVFT